MRNSTLTQKRGTAQNTMSAIAFEKTAALAYQLWNERGCPIGSPDEDWFRAELKLGNHKRLPRQSDRGRKSN